MPVVEITAYREFCHRCSNPPVTTTGATGWNDISNYMVCKYLNIALITFKAFISTHMDAKI